MPMDYHQFKKWITRSGYTIGHSKKHHTIIGENGIVAWFAVHHKDGGKQYVKDAYIKDIKRKLGI